MQIKCRFKLTQNTSHYANKTNLLLKEIKVNVLLRFSDNDEIHINPLKKKVSSYYLTQIYVIIFLISSQMEADNAFKLLYKAAPVHYLQYLLISVKLKFYRKGKGPKAE